MFGIRLALFVVTVIGLFALSAVVASLAALSPVAIVVSATVLAGCVSLILGLRRRLGLWPAPRR